MQAVFVRRRAWDFDGGDVSRASSGAFERLPVVVGDELPAGLRVVGFVAGASKSYADEDFRRPVVLAIGGGLFTLLAYAVGIIITRVTGLDSLPATAISMAGMFLFGILAERAFNFFLSIPNGLPGIDEFDDGDHEDDRRHRKADERDEPEEQREPGLAGTV